MYFTNVVDSKGNYTTRVAIVNTDNGAQLGATRTFTGTYGAYVQISDDDRVTVLADTDTTSKLSVFNAVNGVQIGKTLTYSGSTWTWVTLTTDPNRALAFSVSGSTSKITAIDLTTATTIGTPTDPRRRAVLRLSRRGQRPGRGHDADRRCADRLHHDAHHGADQGVRFAPDCCSDGCVTPPIVAVVRNRWCGKTRGCRHA